MSTQPSTTFETTLAGSGGKTGIVVPPEAVAALGAGSRPPVHVEVNGHGYRSSVAVMGGQHMVAVSAAVRAATGLSAGDPLRVTLTLADTPREVDVPADLAAALEDEPAAGAFVAGLSNSLQHFPLDNVSRAKTPENRQGRVEKAVALFLEGRKR